MLQLAPLVEFEEANKYHFGNLVLGAATKYEAKIKEKARTIKATFMY